MTIAFLHKVMETIQDQDDLTIYNPTSIDFSTFEFTNGYVQHKISQKEIDRPDLLSFIYYGTGTYAYFILRVNSIYDLENVVPGSVIKIPDISDIKSFIFTNQVD